MGWLRWVTTIRVANDVLNRSPPEAERVEAVGGRDGSDAAILGAGGAASRLRTVLREGACLWLVLVDFRRSLRGDSIAANGAADRGARG